MKLRVLTSLFVLVTVVLLATAAPFSLAEPSIHFNAKSKLFFLDDGKISYVFGINEQNGLQHVYWGKHIEREEDFAAVRTTSEWASFDVSTTRTPQEYPGWGAGLYVEPSLKITFPDGNRDLVLHYLDHKIEGLTLTVTLKDIERELYVHLHYALFPNTGILRKEASIENRTGKPVVVESAQSGALYLPQGDGYRLRYLSGRWAGEDQLNEEPVHTGLKVLESRRGSTSHQTNPWFALDRDGSSDPERGSVWFGLLGWSGNWRISVEQTPHLQVRVTAGYNPFDFGYFLPANESLSTPPLYAGYTDLGIGEASRMLHRFELLRILPNNSGSRTRPILYNSWEATEFAVDEPGQSALAEKAASLGIERFVMDDGWFGQRNTDHAGLGDWNVNPKKFPNGLGPLIKKVKSLGMDFGIWVEPEMINPDSDLYRKHPDWAMHFDGRPRTEARNQLILNLARDDVRDYIFQWLDDLVSKNDIAFLKWDYNRNFTEPGWPEVPVEQQKNIYVKFTNNLYDILDRLRKKHPALEIESCSGGGGRVDLGILRYTEEVWPSDNTEAFDRLTIQQGFTYAYTPHIMMAWVTDVPNFNGRSVSLPFRFLTAMQGSLAVGSNLNHWQEEDFSLAKKMIAYYKSVRATVQNGSLYRLTPPSDNNFKATQYVAPDQSTSVLFAFLHSQQFGRNLPALPLRGLDESATYSVTWFDGTDRKAFASLPTTLSGAYLMNHGLDLPLHGDYDALSVKLTRAPN
ncbi:MAG TPA: alpha-galactosidase [Candidatus Acidoferrum sp.]|nr:alpha-galactosidase [Candidatus Acidoferrum sp.]